MNKYIQLIKKIIYCAGGVLLLAACNKDFPNLLQNFQEAKDSPENRDKVLMVIVDGLSGPVVQSLEPANLIEMTRNGMVTYGSLADPTTDFKMTNEAVVSSLLTGVNANKNKVTTNDLSTLNVAAYPTIFSRLKSVQGKQVSSLYTSSSNYATYLGKDAHLEKSATDETVLAAANKGLATDSADLNVVHLVDVDKAGASAEYSDKSTAYVNAIKKMDQQVQQLVNTIKARKSYVNENWLVIVTSGKGGDSKDPVTDFTAFGDAKRATYTLMYSPKFARKILPRPSSKDVPYIGASTRYTYASNNQVIASLADANQFNMGVGSDWTITLFFKFNVPDKEYIYPVFLAKRESAFSGSSPGWNLFIEYGAWGFNSPICDQAFGSKVNDGKWHALTTVIKRSGEKDSIYLYTDGTTGSVSGKFSQQLVKNNNSLDNSVPLQIGYNKGNGNTEADFSICNLQIYNRAFTLEEVQRYGGVTHIDNTYPFWNNLQGYWPGYDDVNTSKLTEKTRKGNDFTIKGPTSWTSFNELVPFFQPPINASFFRQVPNAVDVPFMIYQWLGISVESAWNLDGKSWSPNYVQIRN